MLSKLPHKLATDITRRYELGDEPKQLLRDGMTPAQFLTALMDAKKFPDAVKFLAHAMPKREAVAWAAACARDIAGPNPPPKILNALNATDAWVQNPSEQNRRAAEAAYQVAEVSTPAGCAALSAFLSGGSLAPPNVPAVPPADHLTAHAASGAVTLAAVLTEPEKADEKFKRFLAKGMEYADAPLPTRPAPAMVTAR